MIDANKIQQNWEKHLKIINHFITSPRKELVLSMVETLENEYVLAPASSKTWFHSAFPGGYVEHVNRVVEMSLKVKEMYNSMGGKIDFTDEELVFAALFHDLGKLGDEEKPNYLVQTDDWRKEKMQEIYTYNENLDFMLIQDRSLFLLQKYGVQVNQKEYLAIKCHDGLFDDSNKPYYTSYQESSAFKSNIVYILHTADFLASKIEKDMYGEKLNKSVEGLIKPKYPKYSKKT